MQGGFMGLNFYVVQADLILSPLNVDSVQFSRSVVSDSL